MEVIGVQPYVLRSRFLLLVLMVQLCLPLAKAYQEHLAHVINSNNIFIINLYTNGIISIIRPVATQIF